MPKNSVFLTGLLLALLVMVACAPASIRVELAPTPQPFSLPTLIPPTRVPPTPTTAPTALQVPTAVLPTPVALAAADATTTRVAPAQAATQPTATLVPTTAASPTSASSPTLAASPTLAPSATLAVAAGVYVMNLRTQPDPPTRGADLKFLATFLNSTGKEQNSRWEIYIFKADTPNKVYGETTRADVAIPAGTTEQTSAGSWKLPLGGPCDYFFARVVIVNSENKAIPFTTPDGKVFEKGLTVCPP